MTNGTMNLRALVEKSADANLPREMIGFAAERAKHRTEKWNPVFG